MEQMVSLDLIAYAIGLVAGETLCALLTRNQPKTKTVFWLLCAFEAQVSFALPRVLQDPRPRPPCPNFHLNFSLSSLTFLN
jgi:hypothetical protein